ncbi:MAG: DNA mismatch repair endonuclease MutL [Lishizhenia sp.]
MSEVIRLLPDHIANQIAAGEVIQRPASVVKELIENAIDADATSVTLNVKDAGKTLIQIIDNGKGMSEIDARMSIERHATSKIQEANDLFALTTKGFRGEALASITAIAHVEIKTKERGEELGTCLTVEGSKVVSQEICTTPEGTCISVKNLFFNVPARRNFLKSEKSELNHIIEEFVRIALVHAEVELNLTHNGNKIHALPVANKRKRIVDVFGQKFNDRLVPIEEETDIVKVSGFVVKPEFAKKVRGDQYFFVNNRFFKHAYFNHAVIAAFENLLQPKCQPAYFLFLDVDPAQIDVNVHPTKTEIKFEEDKAIYSILRSTTKLGLGKYNIAPTMDFNRESEFDLPLSYKNQEIKQPTINVDPSFNPFSQNSANSKVTASGRVSATKYEKSEALTKQGFGTNMPTKEDWEGFYTVEEQKQVEEQKEIISQDVKLDATHLQLHGKYLISQVKSGMLLIHVKRAKERIIYDDLMHNFMLQPIASQTLLFPFEQTLSMKEKIEWENNKVALKRLGFDWNFKGDNLEIVGIPNYLSDEVVKHAIDSIVQQLTFSEIDKGELAHTLISALATSAALSGNKYLQKEEINHLVEQLFQCKEHVYSPNGLKILDTITIDELTKRFK